jgi:hypothetical protein
MTKQHWLKENETESENMFLQLIGEIPRNCWFFRAIKFGFIQAGMTNGKKNPEAIAYSKEQNLPLTIFRGGIHSGIILPERKLAVFLFMARKHILDDSSESPILFQPEPLIIASILGYLSVLTISLTGLRIGEVQQLCLDKSVNLVKLPQYNEQDESWEDSAILAYVFEVFTKGKVELQKTYAPDVVIDTMKTFLKVYQYFHGDIIKPIPCNSHEKLFTQARHYEGQNHKWIFQWKCKHLSNSTINACIYFILLEENLVDEDGNPIRLTAHTYRHGFAGFLRQKGVPLERIAQLLHHVNSLVTDYYSQEPDEVILEQLYSIIDEIGGELRIPVGTIRSIDDVRRFEEDCLKRFGALRKVIGGKCGVYCSCEAMNMCARCESYIPEPSKRHEIVAQINGAEKVAGFYKKSGQYVNANRAAIDAQNWKVALAELDKWEKILNFETNTDIDELQWSVEGFEDDPNILPKLLPSPPPNVEKTNLNQNEV